MEPTKKNSSWGELIRFAILVAAIVIPIRMFIAQPFIVSGASMDPTFQDGDYLIVDELSYYLRRPERGEVIIFRPPQNKKTYYIKRIIGLPGDTVTIKDSQVFITHGDDTFKVDEDYIQSTTGPDLIRPLGEKEYFVMGDNRQFSSDSRAWGILPESSIRGRALVRALPITNFAILPGDFSQN